MVMAHEIPDHGGHDESHENQRMDDPPGSVHYSELSNEGPDPEPPWFELLEPEGFVGAFAAGAGVGAGATGAGSVTAGAGSVTAGAGSVTLGVRAGAAVVGFAWTGAGGCATPSSIDGAAGSAEGTGVATPGRLGGRRSCTLEPERVCPTANAAANTNANIAPTVSSLRISGRGPASRGRRRSIGWVLM
jgi:hypothetical protein